MIKKFIAVLIPLFLLTEIVFSQVVPSKTVTPLDVEILFSRLSAEVPQKVNKVSVEGPILFLLAAGCVYHVLKDDYLDNKVLENEEQIAKWLTHKMPTKEWENFAKANSKEIERYLQIKGQVPVARKVYAREVKPLNLVKKLRKFEIFIIAAIGIEVLLKENYVYAETSVSSVRIQIARLLNKTAQTTPEKFALTAYLIPERKIVSSVIAENPNLYALLEKQIEFALSQDNKKFTAALKDGAPEMMREQNINLLKQEIKYFDVKNFDWRKYSPFVLKGYLY